MAKKEAKLAEVKTKLNEGSVEDFLNSVEGDQKRQDSLALLEMMRRLTGEEPRMWGASLIGFGYLIHTSPASGRRVEWFRIGFSPRKANFSIYLSTDIQKHAALLAQLGKHKTGQGCLYINKLADVDVKVLEELMKAALEKGL